MPGSTATCLKPMVPVAISTGPKIGGPSLRYMAGVAARLPLKALVAAIDGWVVHRGCQRIVTGLPTLFLRAVLAVVGMGMH